MLRQRWMTHVIQALRRLALLVSESRKHTGDDAPLVDDINNYKLKSRHWRDNSYVLDQE